MMDVEKGYNTQPPQRPGSGKIFSAASTLLSCIALVGLMTVLVQNWKMQADVQRLSLSQKTVWVPDNVLQEKALHEEHIRSVRGTATATRYACQYQRRRPDYHKNCTDSPQTEDSVPSAHIVPDGTPYPCTIEDPSPYYYSIISVGWSCGSTNERAVLPGYVRGGMIFDRDIGAIIVPVEGIYFVYSQVHVNISNPREVVLSGTQTFICESESGCRTTAYLVSQALTDVTHGPFYHGGLFHLNANSTIKIAAWYDASVGEERGSRADSLAYTAYFAKSFFGAFLVEEIKKVEDIKTNNTLEQSPEEHTG